MIHSTGNGSGSHWNDVRSWLWRDGKPSYGSCWPHNLAVVFEHHRRAVTRFQRNLSGVLDAGEPVGNEAVPQTVVLPRLAGFLHRLGACIL